jgi:ABC-type transport system involved in multi-copper enzyme maturation permease subunit
MFKKIIILGILVSILLVLVIIKSQTSTPVTNPADEISEFKTVEYKISQIKEDEYYGQSDDGTKIVFSADSIDSNEVIKVGDIVICYFEKDNVGKGLVKVQKK